MPPKKGRRADQSDSFRFKSDGLLGSRDVLSTLSRMIGHWGSGCRERMAASERDRVRRLMAGSGQRQDQAARRRKPALRRHAERRFSSASGRTASGRLAPASRHSRQSAQRYIADAAQGAVRSQHGAVRQQMSGACTGAGKYHCQNSAATSSSCQPRRAWTSVQSQPGPARPASSLGFPFRGRRMKDNTGLAERAPRGRAPSPARARPEAPVRVPWA
jgi:hypothetical protein